MTAPLLVAVACAHRTRVRHRVLVLPTDTLGVEAPERERFEGQVRAALDRSPAVADTVSADAHAVSVCGEDDTCLLKLARSQQCTAVVSLRVAGLGETRLLKSRLWDVEQGVPIRDQEETVASDQLDHRAGSLVERWFPADRPWYKSWKTWAIVGAAGALTSLFLYQQLAQPEDVDVIRVGEL